MTNKKTERHASSDLDYIRSASLHVFCLKMGTHRSQPTRVGLAQYEIFVQDVIALDLEKSRHFEDEELHLWLCDALISQKRQHQYGGFASLHLDTELERSSSPDDSFDRPTTSVFQWSRPTTCRSASLLGSASPSAV